MYTRRISLSVSLYKRVANTKNSWLFISPVLSNYYRYKYNGRYQRDNRLNIASLHSKFLNLKAPCVNNVLKLFMRKLSFSIIT